MRVKPQEHQMDSTCPSVMLCFHGDGPYGLFVSVPVLRAWWMMMANTHMRTHTRTHPHTHPHTQWSHASLYAFYGTDDELPHAFLHVHTFQKTNTHMERRVCSICMSVEAEGPVLFWLNDRLVDSVWSSENDRRCSSSPLPPYSAFKSDVTHDFRVQTAQNDRTSEHFHHLLLF